ncbi:DUF799 domain-containing protein [Candidatus Pantoea soli]|uniref:DUF799 domain-containing protein n=1 Tax=Candidatus Pantoea soli TaxID=3098669 RepID=A0A518XAF7_9GAMM|nr:DUF799 domain-containing protein [Pantoea soli]QDY41171.1 hypothetical protein D8B20_04335 [Pantoea soli]
MKKLIAACGLLAALLLTGCAPHSKPFDYSAFRASKPASILVLPADNRAPDINAAHSFTSQVTQPLAEAGYYVFPVAVVEETFQQNGLTNGHEIQAVSTKRLHDIFNADSALYISIADYGSSYRVIDSVTTVTASARLVDLRSGKALWQGVATASDAENSNNNNSGLIGMLVAAAVNQIVSNVSDKAHTIAGVASARLLAQNENGGLLPGPRYKAAVTR